MTAVGPLRRFCDRRRPLVTQPATRRLLSRPSRVAAAALALAAGLLAGGPAAWAQDGGGDDGADGTAPQVLATTIDGSISPVVADHVDEVVDRGEDEGYDAVVLQIDTPGGLEISMRDIVQRLLSSEVPVVAYVSPDGARAASAGAIITLASHVAVMAPGTAIGAATPVQVGGGDVSDADRKAINDAAAFAESLAERRGRDVDFAVDAVREGRSVSASEAVDIGAVDLAAPSLDAALREADGRTVTVGSDETEVTLSTADAVVDTFDMGLFRQIQQILADPNLAFLFMSIGTLGLIYELANPGIGAAGAVGAILIVLGLFATALLPVDAVGLVLLAVAAALFVAELFAPGIGVAAAGGAAALALSAVFLFRDTPDLSVSAWVFGPVAVVVGVAVILAGRLVMRTRTAESRTTGTGLFRDREVHVRESDGTTGRTFVEGAWWNVRSRGPALSDGPARVVDVDGLTLVVEPVAEPSHADRPDGGD